MDRFTRVIRLAAIAAAMGSAAWAGPVLTLYPNNGAPVAGNVLSGNNQTVGWGMLLTWDGSYQSDTTDWIVPTAVQLLTDPSPVGTAADFTDLLGPWFFNYGPSGIAPGGSLNLTWSQGTTGFAEFAFPASSFPLTSPTLTIEMDYDVYDNDPAGGGNWLASAALDTTAQFQVTAPSPFVPTPEPGTWGLAAVGAAVLLAARRRHIGRLLFLALAALPGFAQRPNIVWMHGGHANNGGGILTSFAGNDRIVSAAHDQTLKIWRRSDHALLRTIISFSNGSLSAPGVSPDGSLVQIAGLDLGSNVVLTKVFRLADGSLVGSVATPSASAGGTNPFSPDSHYIAIGGQPCVIVKNTGDWSTAWTLCNGNSPLYPEAFTANGQGLYVMDSSYTLRLYPFGGSTYTAEGCFWGASSYLPMDSARDMALYLNCCGYTNGFAVTPIPQTGACTGYTVIPHTVFDDNSSSSYSAAFSPDDSALATVLGNGNTVHLWHTQSWLQLASFQSEPLAPGARSSASVAFSPDSTVLAAAASELKVFSSPSGAYIGTVTDGAGAVNSVGYSPDGRYVISTYTTSQYASPEVGSLYIRRASDGGLSSTLRPSSSQSNATTHSAALSPDGHTLAVWVTEDAGDDVKLIDASTGSLIRPIPHGGCVGSVAFSPDGATLFVGNSNYYSGCSVRAYNTATGAYLRALGNDTNDHYGHFALSANGQMIATTDGGYVYVNRVSDNTLLAKLSYPYFSVSAVAFSPDNSSIAAGGGVGRTGAVHVWRIADGAHLRELDMAPVQNHTPASVTAVQFSPDGQTLGAAGSYWGGLQIFRISDGMLLQIYDQETGPGTSLGSAAIQTLAYSPDGSQIAWGRGDGVTVVAENPFAPPVLTTGVYPAAGGSISPASGPRAYGAAVTVQATAAPGYAFTGFSGALSGTTNPQQLTLTSSQTVFANFAPSQPKLVAQAAGSSNAAGIETVRIDLRNTGVGSAANATITGISGFQTLAGSGTVSLAGGVPSSFGSIAAGATSAASPVTLNWPAGVVLARFTVQYTAAGGYNGSTVLTVAK